jgi:parallel beta-helix repeat protein
VDRNYGADSIGISCAASPSCSSPSHDNTVTRNFVTGGDAGIWLQRAHDNDVSDNVITDAGTGILLAGVVARNHFRRNRVISSRDTGILLGGGYDFGGDSSGNEFVANRVVRSAGDGVRSELGDSGREYYSDALFRDNVFSDNGGDGLRLDGLNNTVVSNRADRNGNLGIDAVPGTTGGANSAKHNGNPAQCVPALLCSRTRRPKGSG